MKDFNDNYNTTTFKEQYYAKLINIGPRAPNFLYDILFFL